MRQALEKTMTDKPTTTIEKHPKGNLPAKPVLTIDYALYEQYLEGADLSDDQKQEFLDALWSIIVGFVDLGFGVHPLQQIPSNTCGQTLDLTTLLSPDVVSSKSEKPQKLFEKAADRQTGNRAGNADS
jgi:hypothetical protein